MKNINHCLLLKELKRLKILSNCYIYNIHKCKQTITDLQYNDYPSHIMNEAVISLGTNRTFLKKLEEDIKYVKKKIKEVQNEYNHANQQPSTPLTKCEGSETN